MVLDDGQIKRYESELLHALRNKHVRNIAITGGYGAGKSSVIRTFFEKHKTYTPVFVSLATFSKETPGDPQPADSDLMLRIEETIVQQLLYAVPADKLPKTRLKRIVQASNARIVVRTVFFTLLIATGLRFYLPSLEPLPKFVPEGLLPQLLLVSDGWALLIAMGLVAWLLYGALKFLSLFSIDGLTLKGGKLEATHHGSVLHKHVDEIIYCFERSNIDVVVIEDLDRFGIQDVFFRLREINFTIQQSPQVRRSIHFIYAIRDELFSVGDKTKFFDLIIPIIPVVNSENSREKMMELLRAKRFDAQLIKSLDPVLIETVCYHIDEMRLVKNIVNEFDMFSSVLGGSGVKLEANKLFAMVVVRNLYPEAFADLIKRRGLIHSVFDDFGRWRIRQAKKTDEEIAELREQLARMEQEHLRSVEELRVCVWYQVMKLAQPASPSASIYVDDNEVTLTEFVEDSTFEAVLSHAGPLHTHSAFQCEMNPEDNVPVDGGEALELASYAERLSGLTTDRQTLTDRLSALSRQSVLTKRESFRSAAKDVYGDVIARQLQGMDAVIYLMRHGYFDTDYSDYLGFFYEGSLTQNDKNLILALRRGESPAVMTPVNDPELVIGKLDHESLEDGRGLIVGLIEHLCTYAPSGYDLEWEDADQIREGKLASIVTFGGYFDERFAEVLEAVLPGPSASCLIHTIYVAQPEVFGYLLAFKAPLQNSGLRQSFLCALINNLTPDQLETLERNGDGILDSLTQLEDVTDLVPLLVEGIETWGWLRNYPLRFNNLSDTTSANDLRHLLALGCIAPHLDMLRLICSTFDDEPKRTVTYRRLLALELDGVDKLLSYNPEELVEQLLSQDGVLDESSVSLGALISALGDESEWRDSLIDRTFWQRITLEGAPLATTVRKHHGSLDLGYF